MLTNRVSTSSATGFGNPPNEDNDRLLPSRGRAPQHYAHHESHRNWSGLTPLPNRLPTDHRYPLLGASGVLGTAVYDAYKAADHDVTGLAHSRATDRFRKLDLTNFPDTDAFFETARPDCEPRYL